MYQVKTDDDGRPVVVQRAASQAAFATLLTKILDDEPNEVLGMLCLSTTRSVIAYHEISRGTLDGTRVSPRDVFKVALLANAAAIVLGHNHPSGDVTPSSTDISVTRRLAQVGRLIGVEVQDHIVVANGQHVSLQEHCQPPHLLGHDDDQRALERDVARTAVERRPKTTAAPRATAPPPAPSALPAVNEFLNFERLLDRLLTVPRSAVTERIDAHRRQSAKESEATRTEAESEAMSGMPRTFGEAQIFFADPDRCRTFMTKKRWPNGVRCPHCGSSWLYVTASRDRWECKTRHPKRKFTLKTGSIFEDSPLGFDKWLPTVWMVANHRRVSCLDVRRATGVTHRTAWFMLQRIRLATQDVAERNVVVTEGSEIRRDGAPSP